jgi:glucosylceramidase
MKHIFLGFILGIIPIFMYSQTGTAKVSPAENRNQVPEVYYVPLTTSEPITGNPLKRYAQDGVTTDRIVQITVFPQIEYQTFSGIGGCFNEIGGEALLSLPKDKQQEILRNLFDEKEGCGFSFCRTAIGASDFGIDAYSYSETSGDYDMQYFSIARDEKYVLPYIKDATAINPNLKLFASPWSPPGWMKESGKMTGGNSNSVLKDSANIYRAYAKYFVKYIQAYKEHGVKIARLNPQNETDMNPGYPGCIMPPEQMNKLIMDYLIPALKKAKIKTEIWPGTYRVAGKYEAIELFADARLRKAVPGVGIQYTSPYYIDNFTQLYPEIKKMHTECVCHDGANTVEQAKGRWTEISNYLCYGVENFAYWNMILNETGKSGWNWRQNALVTIDRQTGTVTYNPDYAVMYLVGKFIRPGDVRAGHYSSAEPCLAVKGADNRYKIILQNNDAAEKTVRIYLEANRETTVKIPGEALVTIVLPVVSDAK